MMPGVLRRVGVVFIALLATLVVLGVARIESATASTIVQPSASPIVVGVSGAEPIAITIVASGFAPGVLVYIEQCDGVAPSVPLWTPTSHCDLGSSPAPVIAAASGTVTFSATDRNHAFQPFVGESPQSMFNCLAPGRAAPANGLSSFTGCALRVSTNNTAATADQVFRPLSFASAASASPSTTIAPTATTVTRRKQNVVSNGVGVARQRKQKSSANGKGTSKSTSTSTARGIPGTNAVVSAVSNSSHVDLLSFSDPNLATGYVLVVGGLALAGLTISHRRRNPDMNARGDGHADAR